MRTDDVKPVFFKLRCASESLGGLVRSQIVPTPIFPVDEGEDFENCQQPALSDTSTTHTEH